MEEFEFKQPALIGRGEELSRLKATLDNAIAGKGSTIFIAGEAGIGKTRLVSELIKYGGENIRVIQGWCLAESLEPLMPIKTALRKADLLHLVSGDPPPMVVSVYLMNEAGMLIAKAERGETGLDPDIFAGMLQAVGNFVHDSLSMMENKGFGSLNTLGYGDYSILIQGAGKLTLASVIKGVRSEFLIEDMIKTLKGIGDKFDNWIGEVSATKEVQQKISWFIESGKYDGRFLVDDPKLKQENLFDNVLLGLHRASEEKAVLLFIDDLQWSDPTTLNLIHYLARNTSNNRVLLLGTYRPEDISQKYDGKIHQLETTIQNMSREDLLLRVELNRLSQIDTGKVISGALGKVEFGQPFLDKIYKETEGIPFFILEVVKLLAEENHIKKDGSGVWKLHIGIEKLDIPSKVYDVIKRRLDRLMTEQRRILDYASVVGEEFQSEVVGKAMGINRIQLLENLNEIEKMHKLIHAFQKMYRFDHAKIREVLYNGITDELKQEYHRLVADTLAELHRNNPDDAINELAYHYYEAKDGKAGHFLVRAGGKAAEKYANEEAVWLYRRALEVIGEKEEVLEKLADMQVLMGEYDKAIENFQTTKEITVDKETKARLLRKVGVVHEKKGNYDKSLEVLAESKGLVDTDTAEYGRILFTEGYAYYRKVERDKAMILFMDAVNIAQKVQADKKDIGNVLRAIGNIHGSKGEYDKALLYYEKSLTMMEGIGDEIGIAAALGNIGFIHHNRGELDKALEFFGRSLEIREKIGDKLGVAWSLSSTGLVYHNLGELDKALEFLGQSLEIQEKIGDRHGIAMSLNNIGIVHADRGEMDRALKFFTRGLGIHESIGNTSGIATIMNNIGGVYAGRGELNKALECYERSLEIEEKIGNKMGSFHSICGMTDVRLEKGEVQPALELAKKGVDIAVEMGAKSEEGISRRYLGMVYREMKEWDKATEELENAKEITDEVGRKDEMAQVLYEFALLFKAKGEPDKAKDCLSKALQEFERMGMKLWVERCKKALGIL